MSKVVATLELVGMSAEGKPFSVRVSVYSPVSDEPPSTYKCKVEVHPIQHRPLYIFGEGSMQALCLASQHAMQTLATFASNGGVLTHADGSEIDLCTYGLRLLAE